MESTRTTNNEDDDIVRIVREIIPSIGVSYQPGGIVWIGNLGPLGLPSDQLLLATKGPRRGFLVLPTALKGRLALDDWKPLLASAMLLQLRSEFRRYWMSVYILVNLAKVAAVSLLVIMVVLTASGALGPSNLPPLLGSWLILWFVALLVLPKWYNRYVIRGARLRADRRAAQFLGRDQFIQTLEKVDGFKILDLEERKLKSETMWQRHVSPWPTLTERIANLRD